MKISKNDFKHWAEIIAEKAINLFGNHQIVSAGWSPSGNYHIGNSKEAVTCNAINKYLQKLGADSKFLFVIDDFDPLDKIPNNLKKYSTQLRPYLGHPINRIPDFTDTKETYAEFFSAGAIEAMNDFGIEVEFVYASKLYEKGMYNQYLKTYIENNKKLDSLFEDITGSPLDSYVSPICQNCGNMKTSVVESVDNTKISYKCISDRMFRGCDHEGTVKIDSQEWKLKWRLDWPARQTFLDVTVEPSGKDHSVSGGSVDTALAIHQEILDQPPPLLEKYGFITIGGKKISGSKGNSIPAHEVKSIMPVSAYLFLVYRSDLLKDFDFDPESMEYAKLIDEYDDARAMIEGVEFEGREREKAKLMASANLAMFPEERGFIPAQLKFEELALIYQTSLFDADKTLEKVESLGKIPNKEAKNEIRKRIPILKNWLDNLAPKSIIVEFKNEPPKDVENHWNKDVLKIWKNSVSSIDESSNPEEFTKQLRSEAEKRKIPPKEYYQPFYFLLTGKKSGPNAANLVFALGKNEIMEKLETIEARLSS